MNKFHFGTTANARNKEIKGDLSLGWRVVHGDIDDISKVVTSGAVVGHGCLSCDKRLDANFDFAEIVLVDVDNSSFLKDANGKAVLGEDGKGIKVYHEELTIAQALDNAFIREHCFYAYTSASHKEGWDKYRLGFLLPNRIKDKHLFKAVMHELKVLFPALDVAAMSVTNLLYGNTNAIEFIKNPDAKPLPESLINKAKERIEAEKVKAEKQYKTFAFSDNSTDKENLIMSALFAVPVRIPNAGTYNAVRDCIWALCHEYGQAKAIAIMENHSPSSGKWNVEKIARAYDPSRSVSIGTLFYHAISNGWSFPKRSKAEIRAFRIKKIEEKVTESKLDFYSLRKPDLSLNQQYLSAFEVPKNKFWVGVKSYKGTGKNYFQMELAAKIYKEIGLPILYVTQLTNLVNLAAEPANAENPTGLGLVSIYELMGAKQERREELVHEIFQNGLACTFDSFHKIKAILPNFVPFVTFFDEAESGAECVLDSSTDIKNHRTETIACISNLMKASKLKYPNAHAYCFDSDLTDISLDWYTSLTGDRLNDAYIVRNDYKVAAGRIAYVYPDRKAWLNGYVETTDRTICYANSQQVTSKFSGKNLNELTGNSLIIDSDTTKNPEEKAYRCLLDNKYLGLMRSHQRTVHTSSMGIGVSIKEEGLFDSKYCISFGSQGVGKLLQGVDRYRNNIPLHIWVQQTGLGIVGRGAVDWREVYADLIKNNDESLKALNIADIYDESGLKKSAETYAKLIARRNYELLNYAENVRKKLIEDGYDVRFVKGNEDSTLSKELKEIKDAKVDTYCQAVNDADISDEEEIEAIQRKQGLTDEERIKLAKVNLQSRYLTELNPTLVRTDLDGNYSKLRLQYYLTDGFEYLPQRDKERLESLLGDDKLLFSPDVNKSLLAGKIGLLKMIDPMKFIEEMGSDEVKDDDDRVIEFWQHLKTFEVQLARFFGIKLDGKKAMTDIKKILRTIAHDFVSDSKSKKRNKPKTIQQIYKDKKDIFEKWLEYDFSKIAETTISRAEFPNNNIVIGKNCTVEKNYLPEYNEDF